MSNRKRRRLRPKWVIGMQSTFETQPLALFRPLVSETLRFAQRDNILYLKNPKCGCSTVMGAMIRRIGQVEGIDLPPVLTPRHIHGAGPWWSQNYQRFRRSAPRSFSIVRNPYVRVLSAYLDKIARPNVVGRQFRVVHGLDPKAPLSFAEFLGLLDPARHVFDQHWRPQVQLLLVGHLRLDRVHFLEDFSTTAGDLEAFLDRRLGFAVRDRHATGAADRLAAHYTEAEAATVRRLYAEDFATFGYSDALKDAARAPGPVLQIPAGTGASLTTLALIGLVITQASAQRLRRIAERKPLAPEDRLLLHLRPDTVALSDPDALERELHARAEAGHATPVDRALWHQFRLQQARHAGDPAAEAAALQDLAGILPFGLIDRVRLVKCLVASGAHSAAREAVSVLEQATWQHDAADRARALLG